ncbi:MAG: hypothetical protein WBC60_19920 [Cognaticolwellia sp.]
MESVHKEQENIHQHPPEEANSNQGVNTPRDNQPEPLKLSSSELMNQWRCNLKQLLKDLEIFSGDNVMTDEAKDIDPEIKVKIDYLKKTDDLLQEHNDFALSEAGFEKYKANHFNVMHFLTQLHQQKKTDEDNKTVKFYLLSRAKHINQQTRIIPWSLAFFHLIILVIASLTLVFGALAIIVSTQGNGIVLILLLATFLTIFRITKSKIKQHKKRALTPLRFNICLLSIYSLTTVLYASFFIITPILVVAKIKFAWLDDIIIIGLALFSFSIWRHSQKEPNKAKIEPIAANNVNDIEAIK